MAPLVVLLSRRAACSPATAGGKGASLARLTRAGYPVPPGFVITTAAFREPLAAALRVAGRDGNLARARRACLDWAVPDRLRRSVLAARRRLGPGPVAVRSSMVGEDAVAASFAGQLESVLSVSGDDALIDAVRRVLASAFGDRLWTYLGPAGGRALALAAVVQSMVPAESAGVAFSVDPVSGRPGIIIEAAAGLGDGLVRGRVRPDRYRLDPRGELAEAVPVRPGSPLLAEAAVRALGELVHEIAVFAEAPQDVEWAYADGRFHILQARPISAMAGRPVYSRRMVSDMAPGVVKPLVWSAKYAPIVRNVFAPVLEELAGPTGLDYSRVSARIHSRVYVNVTAFGEVFKRLGLPSNFFYVLAREDKATRSMFRFRLDRLPALVRHVRFVRRESRIGRRVGPFLESHSRALDAFRTLDWAAEPPEALLGHFDRLKTLHGRTQWYMILVSVNMLIRSRLLGRMIVRRWPGTDPRDVIKGYGRRSSLAPFEEMRGLAAEARGLDRALLERIAGPDDLDVAGALAALPPEGPGASLRAGFDRFMARFGFLSANGSDFSETPWIESPRLIWRTVARLALQVSPEPSTAGAEARRDEVLALVRAGFGAVRRQAFDRLHASTVRYMDCRERVSLAMTEDSYWMRRCLLALGAKLVGRGVVGGPADVFYLFTEELERAVRDPDSAPAAAVAELVAARKVELARDAALDAPETICGDEALPLETPSAAGLEFLAGIGASAGRVRGRARVVLDPGLADRDYGPGDILVVPFTDVGWTPILAAVGGVVAESGGQLSHTSIIAREYGLPAVVSVRNVTRLVPDGALLTVDGTAGRVYIHSDGTP